MCICFFLFVPPPPKSHEERQGKFAPQKFCFDGERKKKQTEIYGNVLGYWRLILIFNAQRYFSQRWERKEKLRRFEIFPEKCRFSFRFFFLYGERFILEWIKSFGCIKGTLILVKSGFSTVDNHSSIEINSRVRISPPSFCEKANFSGIASQFT